MANRTPAPIALCPAQSLKLPKWLGLPNQGQTLPPAPTVGRLPACPHHTLKIPVVVTVISSCNFLFPHSRLAFCYFAPCTLHSALSRDALVVRQSTRPRAYLNLLQARFGHLSDPLCSFPTLVPGSLRPRLAESKVASGLIVAPAPATAFVIGRSPPYIHNAFPVVGK